MLVGVVVISVISGVLWRVPGAEEEQATVTKRIATAAVTNIPNLFERFLGIIFSPLTSFKRMVDNDNVTCYNDIAGNIIATHCHICQEGFCYICQGNFGGDNLW